MTQVTISDDKGKFDFEKVHTLLSTQNTWKKGLFGSVLCGCSYE